MSTAPPLRRRPDPPDLHDHAIRDLRYIRQTMERAGSLTSFPGWGQVVVGVTAIAAALAAASWARTPEGWITVWGVESLVAMAIGTWSMARKAQAASVPLGQHPAGRRFVLSFSLPVIVGALLTLVLYQAGAVRVLPGMWLLLYGTAVATGGAFSVPIVPFMGYAFMGVGTLALFAPAHWANAILGLAFGGMHVAFGLVIARRYGG